MKSAKNHNAKSQRKIDSQKLQLETSNSQHNNHQHSIFINFETEKKFLQAKYQKNV
jgi:hypothetical protein